MTFTPRLKAPTNSGFYSGYRLYGTNAYNMWEVGGNCTHYAACRFHEILGKYDDPPGCQVGYGNAEDWWGNHKGYKSGKVPDLGAILCLKDGPYSGWGHVAIVEAIYDDGSILTSEGGYESFIFDTTRRYPPYYNSDGYGFQGFIYNPASSGIVNSVSTALNATKQATFANQIFVAEAAKHIGPQGHRWVQSQVPIGNSAWCAATICAIAKVLGWSEILPTGPNDYPSWAVCVGPGDYTLKRGGKRIDGPGYGSNIKPNPGDIVVFDWSPQYTSGSGSLKSRYIPNRDHVGIVEKVEGDIVHTIEGNADNTYRRRTYKYNSKVLLYYDRPDWSKVGSYIDTNSDGQFQPLYETKSTRADALIRDVGYFTSKGEPTVSSSQIGMSVINYTSILGTLTSALGGTYSTHSEGNIDVTGLTDTVQQGVARYLAAKGLNRAAIAGVMGNIEAESGFRLDAIEMGPPYEGRGLCQWSYGRRERLYKRVPDWKHNLEGQMDLLWWELENEYNTDVRPVLRTLKSVPHTPQGCYDACKMFVRRFEVPAGWDTKSTWDRRYERAKRYYDKLKLVLANNTTVTNKGRLNNRTAKKVVTIPSSVKQSGMIAEYTYYPKAKWTGSPLKVHKRWVEQGSKSANNIATIDNFYLISVRASRFGNVGDIVKIVLEDGTVIEAIIANTTAAVSARGAEWGNRKSSGVSIIEWESVTSDQSVLNKNLFQLGWLDKKVTSITNYGSYI